MTTITKKLTQYRVTKEVREQYEKVFDATSEDDARAQANAEICTADNGWSEYAVYEDEDVVEVAEEQG